MVKNINIYKSLSVALCIITLIIVLVMVILGYPKNETTLAENNEEKIPLPIIMYHSLLKDSKMQNDYTISPDIFENDLKFLKNNGYTTITVNDLINYTYSDNSLPEKCIMLTFDDGYYNNYYYAFPLLKKYEAKAVISPIASMVEKFSKEENISVSYGTIGNKEIAEMLKSDCVEIQNHSYDLHRLTPRKGIKQKQGESVDEYKSSVSEDIIKAQKYFTDNISYTPQCFVYPFGAKSTLTEGIIKELGFKCTLNCTEKMNYVSKNPDSLYELGRFRRDGNESIESLINRMYK